MTHEELVQKVAASLAKYYWPVHAASTEPYLNEARIAVNLIVEECAKIIEPKNEPPPEEFELDFDYERAWHFWQEAKRNAATIRALAGQKEGERQ